MAWASVPLDTRLEFQKWYGANSAGDPKHPELWVRGANLLIPRLSAIARRTHQKHTGLRRCPWHEFNGTGTAELKRLFDAYGSDKGTDTHSLHHAYAHIIEQLGGPFSRLRVLEVGLGSRNQKVVSAMARDAKPPGGSLRCFRDFLPNAMVFGADVDDGALFNESRIQTAQADQLERASLDALYRTFGSQRFDLVIDDGLHAPGANLNVLEFALQHLRPGGYVVIEDIKWCAALSRRIEHDVL
jgi:SAM-dependent methyltransferase